MQCPACEQSIHPIQEMKMNGGFMNKCPREECQAVIAAQAPLDIQDGVPRETVALEQQTAMMVEAPASPPLGPSPSSTYSTTMSVAESLAAQAAMRLAEVQKQQQELAAEEAQLRRMLGEDPH